MKNKKDKYKGIILPAEKDTVDMIITPMTLPQRVSIPMVQHQGLPCAPVVAAGDRVRVGQVIGDARGSLTAPIHSSVSGTVVSVDDISSQFGVPDKAVVIEADGRQEVADEIVPPVINNQSDFLAAVRASGIVGLGGAGFPLYSKFKSGLDVKVDTLIVNGLECEPYITVDHMVMKTHTAEILDGIEQILRWMSIDRAIIAVGSDHADAAELFEKKLSERSLKAVVRTIPQSYPMGAEQLVIRKTTGRELLAGRIPQDVGCVVCNVTTVLKLRHYLATGLPLVTKFLTVSGNAVKSPMNVEAPIGTSIADVLEFCGGPSAEIRKVLLDGVMMGHSVSDMSLGITKMNNAVLCFDEVFARPLRETACINCARCLEACPSGLMPGLIAKALDRGDMEAVRDGGAERCISCGLCSYVCPARRRNSFRMKQAKVMLAAGERS